MGRAERAEQMSKEIYISSTPHETRLAIVENDALAEIYYERENEYTLAGSIYNGKVTRVLPGMQSSFVDIGLERDAFLYITDFMEEAGDSADFDTADGHRPRTIEGQRSDNRRDRNGSPEDATATTDDSSRSSDRGGERSDRGDRGRDRGGRGRRDRRDRGGNRDRQPGSDTPQPLENPEAIISEFNRPVSFAGDSATVERTDSSDLGEGAPGADGSRRWRGRRGRRRGRGAGPRDESPQLSGNEAQPSFSPQEGPGDGEYDDSFDIDGAATRPVTNESAPIPNAYGAPEAGQENSGRRDRGDRGGDRGGRDDRNRDRDRGGRGGRRDERRVPRGFAPKTALYGVDNTPAYNETPESDGPVPEPIVLPGESLSKYRKGSDEPAATTAPKAPENIIIPQVASYAIPEGWDGGAILPGESLSRHRRSETPQEPRASHRADFQAAYRNEAPAQQAEPLASQHETHHVAEAHEQQPENLQDAQHQEPAPVLHTEYEPIEASASYRVDPAAPSEFRHSAVLEQEVEQQHEFEVHHQHQTAEFHAPTLHAIFEHAEPVGDTDLHIHDHHHEHVHAQPVSHQHEEQTEPVAHEFTTVHPTGEMATEPPVAALVPQETGETASPIQHETAVINPAENAVEDGIEPFRQFAPGEGALEEEIIEDEDYRVTLHASHVEELDDLDEEETLEGAADLGTMLREMSIDQITRSGVGAEEDEDDLEEEDSIDDRSLDSLDEDEEEDEGEEYDSEVDADSEEELVQDQYAEGAELPPSNGFDTYAAPAVPSQDRSREGDRNRGRRDGRRDGRRGDRGRGDRARHTGGSGDRERSGGGRDRRGGRSSMQATNLPAISELLKPGQEILVQIAKEPIAKKGARITSHIALPGRFLVFMPTVNHTGVSRKIESDSERRRLKEILLSEKGEAAGGFIVRTAASGASEEELRSDLRFLLNLWADIKQRSESSKSPALIYHDLNLVERILRDQVTDTFSAIWVDTETEYERVLRFLQRFQPSLIRRVKLYTKETPLFEQFGITEEINKALRSKVWLKSGGSIVINQTEALVAIDINTGKFVGKTARLEDTIVKTNLDAIPEIVRQIRLRDLGGIIIIDFIDMDERKNRNKVMAALEEELKNDRAPSKVLQFNDFGLVAITRKRVKQSLERTLSTTCNVCVGTGMVKSPVTVCNDIYIEMRKMHKHLDRGDVMLRVHPEVVKQLKSTSSRWLQEMEEMVGKTILVKSDPTLHPEQFDIH
jgi:ribonuclease E